jgi:hypothetical protein
MAEAFLLPLCVPVSYVAGLQYEYLLMLAGSSVERCGGFCARWPRLGERIEAVSLLFGLSHFPCASAVHRLNDDGP